MPAPSPSEIVTAAGPNEWADIAPSDLLVMDLAADAAGKPRQVVIQLMPAPFSQGWVHNIRKLVAARWYDGVSVNRVQDNYVVQWGDADAENAAKAKPLPAELAAVPESEYGAYNHACSAYPPDQQSEACRIFAAARKRDGFGQGLEDDYRQIPFFFEGWPLGIAYYLAEDVVVRQRNEPASVFGPNLAPIHCYGMVGVGRGLPPDTGSGAELYTVIGHAPRHLDRNIAIVGRVIAGIEHLSSLPRGSGPLGFYEDPVQRVPIVSVRMGNETPDLPAYEYLNTDSASFAKYAEARANRRDPFFIKPAGGADICNIPVPIRQIAE